MLKTATPRDEFCLKLSCGWVFVQKQGDGPPLLLLHAAGMSSWVWRRVIDELAANFTVYAPDLPGFDRSETPDHFFTIEEFTGVMVELLDRLSVEKSAVMGNLTGAMIGLDMAVRYPDRVEKLVLVSCPGWTPEEGKIVYERFFVPWYGEDGIPRQTRPTDTNRSDEYTDYSNSILARNGLWFAKVHDVNTAFDIPSRIGQVRQPTLLVYGETCAQRRREQRMREGIAGVQVAIVSNAESHSQYEQPELFLESTLPFLTGASNAIG